LDVMWLDWDPVRDSLYNALIGDVFRPFSEFEIMDWQLEVLVEFNKAVKLSALELPDGGRLPDAIRISDTRIFTGIGDPSYITATICVYTPPEYYEHVVNALQKVYSEFGFYRWNSAHPITDVPDEDFHEFNRDGRVQLSESSGCGCWARSNRFVRAIRY
jgi:hypothetical protein